MLPFTLQQLQILKAIAAEKQFTKAAKLLYLSQPSLSKQIKSLEENLGVLLVNRDKNQIFLTENGEIFLEYSERILALCEESCRIILARKNVEQAILTVGTSKVIGIYLIPKILTLFARTYPQVRLKVFLNLAEAVIEDVKNQKIDIAILEKKISFKFDEDILVKDFIKNEFCMIISHSHPFAKKNLISKEELYDLNFIKLNSTSYIENSIEKILLQNQIEVESLKTIMELNSIEGVKTAVSLGLGVAFVPSYTIEREIKFQMIKIINIENFQIEQILSIITNTNSKKSKIFHFFHNKLYELKENIED